MLISVFIICHQLCKSAHTLLSFYKTKYIWFHHQIQVLKLECFNPHTRGLRNGKRYNTHPEGTISENGSIEENVGGNSSEKVEGEVREIHTLSQEAINEQLKEFIVP